MSDFTIVPKGNDFEVFEVWPHEPVHIILHCLLPGELWCTWCGASTPQQCDCGPIDPMD